MSMTHDSQTTAGWVIFVAAIGMMFGLLAVDIVKLKDFSEISTPLFVGTAMGHIASVITAFVGGKLIPENREGIRTREDDDRT